MPSRNSEKGMMHYCHRCDEKIFLKYVGKGETDGGYTTWDKYEDLPEGWLYETEFGYLCPKCAREFKIMMTNFFNGDILAKWRIDVEEVL